MVRVADQVPSFAVAAPFRILERSEVQRCRWYQRHRHGYWVVVMAAYHGSWQLYSRHAAIYSDGGVQDIGILTQNLNSGGDESFGVAINNSGEVVGYGGYGIGPDAFFYSEGTMPGPWHARGATGMPRGINNIGQAVGSAD